MHGVRISYLIEHPEHIPQLAQWVFEQWGSIIGEKTPEKRIKNLQEHMNRDKLPIAWVAHASGQLLGCAALRVDELEGREDLTPWLGGVIVGSHFRRQGIGAALMRHCRGRGPVARDTDSLFVHARQAGVVFTPRLDSTCPACVVPAARRRNVQATANRLTNR